MRQGTISIHVDHRRVFTAVNRLVLGIVTSALLVSSALLWSMKAPPTIENVSVVGAASYLVAAYLGWRLLRTIKLSRDVKSSQ